MHVHFTMTVCPSTQDEGQHDSRGGEGLSAEQMNSFDFFILIASFCFCYCHGDQAMLLS